LTGRAEGIFLAFLLLLTSCGSGDTADGDERAIPPAYRGLAAALATDDAPLVAETLVQIMEAGGEPRLDVRRAVAWARERPGGAARIDRTAALLRRSLVTGTDEEKEQLAQSAAFVALVALDGAPSERAAFMSELRKAVAGQKTKLSGASEQAFVYAAALYQPDAGEWLDLLRSSKGSWRGFLLLEAVRAKAAVPAAQAGIALADTLAKTRYAPPPLLFDSFAFDYGDWANAGLARMLLERNGMARTAPPTPAERIAEAEAALALGDNSVAMRALAQAAAAAAPDFVRTQWVKAAGLMVQADPQSRPALARLANGLTWQVPDAIPFNQLLLLGSDAFLPQALAVTRSADLRRLGTGAGPLHYIERIRSPREALDAFCESKWGSMPPEDVRFEAMTESDSDSINVANDPATGLARRIPKDLAVAYATEKLRADPERLTSACLRYLIREQHRQGSSIHAAARKALAGRPSLAAELDRMVEAVNRHEAYPRYARVYQGCIAFEAGFRQGRPESRETDAIVEYVGLCPSASSLAGAETGLRFPELLRSAARPALAADAAVNAVWFGREAPLEDGMPVEYSYIDSDLLFPLLLHGVHDPDMLYYPGLVEPLMVGRGMRDRTPGRDRGDERPGAARFLLVTGDEAVARWASARLAKYETREPRAMAATIATLKRAWLDVDPMIERLNRATARLGGSAEGTAEDVSAYRRRLREQIAEEVIFALERLCSGTAAKAGVSAVGESAGPNRCIGSGAEDAKELSDLARKDEIFALSNALDTQLGREQRSGLAWKLAAVLALHLLVWTLLFMAYPRSPAVQASVFWNPWVRKYLGLGYVQFLLLVVPPFTRRLLAPFADALAADGRLEDFRGDFYYDSIQGRRTTAAGAVVGRLAELIPAVDRKIWLEAKSGFGKTWFLRELAVRARRPVIFLNATSCVRGVPAALKERTAGWVAESDFLDQLIHSGRVVVIIDGLNEVAPEIRSDIVVFANRFSGGRILIATQTVKGARPIGAERVEVLALARDQIGAFLQGRAAEVLRPEDDLESFIAGVRAFMDHLDEGTPDEQKALLEFISNPMDLRFVADLLGARIEPDLLNLQEQQIRLVEEDYQAANGSPFPIVPFSEFLYQQRQNNQSQILTADNWPSERVALLNRRLVLREDAPDGGDRWRFRHDKITDYFLYRAFQAQPKRFDDHLADNRFIGVYILLARKLPRAQAETMLTDIYWAAGRADDFTIGKAFQDALEQKLALQGRHMRRGAFQAQLQ
jgi:hypothetical protein